MAVFAVEDVGIRRAGKLLWLGRWGCICDDASVWVELVLNEPNWFTARNVDDAAAISDEVSRMAKKVAIFSSAISAKHDTLLNVEPWLVSLAIQDVRKQETYMKVVAMKSLAACSRPRKTWPGIVKT